MHLQAQSRTWYLDISQGGTVSSSYIETHALTYPIAFPKKVLGGSVSVLYDRTQGGGSVAYFYGLTTRTAKIVKDVINSGFSAPVSYIVFGL